MSPLLKNNLPIIRIFKICYFFKKKKTLLKRNRCKISTGSLHCKDVLSHYIGPPYRLPMFQLVLRKQFDKLWLSDFPINSYILICYLMVAILAFQPKHKKTYFLNKTMIEAHDNRHDRRKVNYATAHIDFWTRWVKNNSEKGDHVVISHFLLLTITLHVY